MPIHGPVFGCISGILQPHQFRRPILQQHNLYYKGFRIMRNAPEEFTYFKINI